MSSSSADNLFNAYLRSCDTHRDKAVTFFRIAKYQKQEKYFLHIQTIPFVRQIVNIISVIASTSQYFLCIFQPLGQMTSQKTQTGSFRLHNYQSILSWSCWMKNELSIT